MSGSVSGQHAVPEVEHVARASVVAPQHVAHAPASTTAHGARHTRGVEVALHAPCAPTRARATSSGTRQSTPTTSAPGVGHQRQQLARAHAEVDAGHAEVGQAREDLRARRQHVGAVVGGRERAGPAVEQLHRAARPPPPAPAATRGRCRRGGRAARATSCGLGVHQRLGAGVALRRAAFDEVAGERERRAGEADERHVELGHEQRDGLGHVGRVGRRARTDAAVPGRRRRGTARPRPGPRPGAISTPMPMAASGTTMSENRMAASTP